MAWTFNPADYTENDFAPIPVGDHRVRINDAIFKRFSSGNEGYEITLDVSGHSGKLWFYLVLDPNDRQKTNQRIGAFFDSFGITNYDMNAFSAWKGKIGAVRVRHEEYQGNMSAKVAFCLAKKKQSTLPAWKETGNASTAPAPASASPVVDGIEIIDDELPF